MKRAIAGSFILGFITFAYLISAVGYSTLGKSWLLGTIIITIIPIGLCLWMIIAGIMATERSKK